MRDFSMKAIATAAKVSLVSLAAAMAVSVSPASAQNFTQNPCPNGLCSWHTPDADNPCPYGQCSYQPGPGYDPNPTSIGPANPNASRVDPYEGTLWEYPEWSHEDPKDFRGGRDIEIEDAPVGE
jgi:hypothetical protein